MKPEKQEQAKALRKKGFSISEIQQEIGCSRSSISRWIYDVPVNELYTKRLESIRNALNSKIKIRYKEKRQTYQNNGRLLASTHDPLFVAGCMLYWGEGDKSRNQVGISNSDPHMLKLFISFLKMFFKVNNEDLSIHIQCYTDLTTQYECEDFWLRSLGLPKDCLRKTQVNKISINSKLKRKNKLKFGTCKLRISKTEIVQTIYGGIKEIAGINNNMWI